MSINFVEIFSQFSTSTLLLLTIIAIVAGITRGFAGFGSGLILMPVASALIDPRLAVAIFLITDFVATLPLLPPAMRRCNWQTVLPTAITALIFVPIGVFALVQSDPIFVRWGISILTISMLFLLISGWRYQGRPHLIASLGVGATSGFLSGIAQIGGPPIVTYWLSGSFSASIIRANLIVFFFITSLSSFLFYFFNNLFTPSVLAITIIIAPIYALAIWIGARLHGIASERIFRMVAYALIAIAGFSSLPVFDGLLRGG